MRRRMATIGAVGTLLLLAVSARSGLNDGLNRGITDWHWRHALPQQFPPGILVIGIDDRTVEQFGRLRYWSRARYAELLGRLGQARAVGLDIIFSDPDAVDKAGDQALAAALAKQGRTATVYYEWREVRPVGKAVQAAVSAMEKRLVPLQPGQAAGLGQIKAVMLEPPIPGILDSAAGLGASDVTSDPDGVFRRADLVRVTDAGGAVPHFTLAVACLATGTRPADAVATLPGALTLGGRRVPVSGGILRLQSIARRGGGSGRGVGLPVPGLSFAEALTKPPEFFKDQIVLVGETATGTSDVRPNPLDQGLRGVELNAEILANLLTLPPVRELPGAAGLALLLVVILAPLLLYSSLPPKPASAGALAAMGVAALVMEAAFWMGRMVPAWATVGVGSVGATLLMALQRVVQEEQQKRVLRDSFRMYVAPELVEEIVRDPAIAAQEGTRQTVAVLFSDIRSFTTYCEGHTPEVIIRQMREYLGGMADAVDACHGVLDKYIGDAVMALFGPFLEDGTEPSALAVVCGLNMLDRLAALNAAWAAEGLQPFKIGIGIHVGEAVVGNIGSPRRMQYTALGDAVNLASRLESNTKELHVEFVVSEDVKERVETGLARHATFHDLGTITVRNRAQPVRVYEVRRATAPPEASET